jgi:hypothetical protein
MVVSLRVLFRRIQTLITNVQKHYGTSHPASDEALIKMSPSLEEAIQRIVVNEDDSDSPTRPTIMVHEPADAELQGSARWMMMMMNRRISNFSIRFYRRSRPDPRQRVTPP